MNNIGSYNPMINYNLSSGPLEFKAYKTMPNANSTQNEIDEHNNTAKENALIFIANMMTKLLKQKEAAGHGTSLSFSDVSMLSQTLNMIGKKI